MKRRYVDTGPDRTTEDKVNARSGGVCEICAAQPATQHHHRMPRGMGSSSGPQINLPSNLLHLDLGCHEYVERNRAEALIAGWLVSRYSDPARVNVLIQNGSRYVYLTDDGGYADNPPEAVAS